MGDRGFTAEDIICKRGFEISVARSEFFASLLHGRADCART